MRLCLEGMLRCELTILFLSLLSVVPSNPTVLGRQKDAPEYQRL